MLVVIKKNNFEYFILVLKYLKLELNSIILNQSKSIKNFYVVVKFNYIFCNQVLNAFSNKTIYFCDVIRL